MTIFTLENLYTAYKDCIKRKKNTANALVFEMDREKNLSRLLYDLKTGRYEISRHICFIVTHPSAREIFAADFRDRIVHHLLYSQIQNLFESDFIEHSYANRVGKGTHKAMQTVRREFIRGGRNRQKLYYLKLDIQSFFRSINKEILYTIVEKKIQGQSQLMEAGVQREILWLCKKIISHNPTSNYVYKGDIRKKSLIPKHKSLFYAEGRGLPIGNLTSQFFANVYLNKLDHFVTKDLGIEKYVRYVDDLVLIDENRDKLKSFIKKVDEFLKEQLDMRLHRGKICLQETRKGVDFLGYFIKPTHTLVRQKVVRRFKNKFFKILDEKTGFIELSDIPMIKSYQGHFSHANSYNLQKRFGIIISQYHA